MCTSEGYKNLSIPKKEVETWVVWESKLLWYAKVLLTILAPQIIHKLSSALRLTLWHPQVLSSLLGTWVDPCASSLFAVGQKNITSAHGWCNTSPIAWTLSPKCGSEGLSVQPIITTLRILTEVSVVLHYLISSTSDYSIYLMSIICVSMYG
jgi:hypothetical protein